MENARIERLLQGMRAEIKEMRTEMRAGFKEVRGDIQALRQDMEKAHVDVMDKIGIVISDVHNLRSEVRENTQHLDRLGSSPKSISPSAAPDPYPMAAKGAD